MSPVKISVLGAGNGGQAMAADLAAQGHEITLYELPDFASVLDPISERGAITLIEGDRRISAQVETSTDIGEVLSRTDLVNVVVPAHGHDKFFAAMLPHLRPHHVVVVWAGRLGSLRLAKLARDRVNACEFGLIEATTLPYGAQLEGPGEVGVLFRARELHCAEYPSDAQNDSRARLEEAYPDLQRQPHVVGTFLRNSSLLVLPTATLLNVGCIEKTDEEYCLFRDGVTESVAEVIAAVNREFVTVGRAYGVDVPLYSERTIRAMGSVESVTYKTTSPEHYAQLRGPEQIRHRYVVENIPFGFVPVSQLGTAAGVETPTIDSLVSLAGAMLGKDVVNEARTLSTLGLDGLNSDEISRVITKGWEN